MLNPDTFFAPPGRASKEQLQGQSQSITQTNFVLTLLDAMATPAMILNEQRQIVAANSRLLLTFGIDDAARLIGRRPGEILGCIHISPSPDGCGTAPGCQVCGAVRALLDCQDTEEQISKECRIALGELNSVALDLEATASPLLVAGQRFTVLALKDISAEKRKQVMERIFFHDIINTAGGIRGLAGLLAEHEDIQHEAAREYMELMLALSDNLLEEIKSQRNLVDAEQGTYRLRLKQIEINDLLRGVCELYANHERTPGREVRFEESGNDCLITTDPPILRRIIGNMLLNALEAIPRGQIVQVRSIVLPESVRIEVSNPGEMPLDTQLSMFNRSFSSKSATGRGIGTYSMKLFGERYLGGRVGFTCKEGQTTFFIELPR